MPSADGAWLRSQRQARGWAAWEMARRIAAAAGDERRTLPDHETLMRYVRRWEAGKCRMTERYQLLCRKAFGLDDYGPPGDGARPGRRSVLAGGLLAGSLLAAVGSEALERLAWAERHPPRIDASAVDALAGLLAAQRHGDDVLGSAAMLKPVMAQLAVVEELAAEARGPLRPAVIDIAQQWTQFAGHLHIACRDFPAARALCGETLELAIEADDATMTATVLRLRGYMAWLAGEPGPTIGLARAAQRDTRAAASERAYGASLEACGHAMTADAPAAERKLGEMLDLAGQMISRPERERPWSYWFTPQWFECQRGVALGYLAHSDRHRALAIEALTAGYAGLGSDAACSEWGTDYLVHRAAIHARGGDVAQACADALQAVPVWRRTSSASLKGMLTQLHAGLAARYPGDPRVAGLADALR